MLSWNHQFYYHWKVQIKLIFYKENVVSIWNYPQGMAICTTKSIPSSGLWEAESKLAPHRSAVCKCWNSVHSSPLSWGVFVYTHWALLAMRRGRAEWRMAGSSGDPERHSSARPYIHYLLPSVLHLKHGRSSTTQCIGHEWQNQSVNRDLIDYLI